MPDCLVWVPSIAVSLRLKKSVYRNLPMWSVPIELHRRMPQLPLFCDPSHIGGRRDAVAPLAQQAMDLGFDGLIVEAHAYPDAAWSDKEQQVTPLELAEICRRLVVREGLRRPKVSIRCVAKSTSWMTVCWICWPAGCTWPATSDVIKGACDACLAGGALRGAVGAAGGAG